MTDAVHPANAANLGVLGGAEPPAVPAPAPRPISEADAVSADAARTTVVPEPSAPAAGAAASTTASTPPGVAADGKIAAPVPADPEDPSHVLLHMPVHVRSVTLVLLAALLVLATLRWAQAFFIPLMLGLMFSYALSPIVDRLERWHIPRWLSAAVLIVGLLGATGASIYSMADDANAMIQSLPAAATKLRDKMRQKTTGGAPLDTVQKAAAQIEQAAAEAGTPTPPPPRGVQRVVVEKPAFNLREHLWSGTMGLVSLIGQVVVVTFLTYFLLLSGDTFRRKLVKVTEGGLSNKKITVQALDEITAQIQRFLLVQLGTSIIVGVATWLSFWALGLNHAAVWGVAGGVLNLIPYIGSVVVMGASALAAFMQFGEVDKALYVAGASLLIHTIVGNLLVPWLTSRTSAMNPVAVFIGVLAWGWLWGVWGLLLGIPILMIVKAICDRVDHLKPVGELLGN